MRKKVLWIEDSAFDETAILATPVHLSGEYDLDIALTATQAMSKLAHNDYEAVVVDIRLPPGEDRRWKNAYYGSSKDAKLGLVLLRTVLKKNGLNEEFRLTPSSRDPHRYGVLSVESSRELGPELAELGVLYFDKASESSDTLLRAIQAILQQRDTVRKQE